MGKTRAQLVFQNSIKSEATRRQYARQLSAFAKYLEKDDEVALLKIKPKVLQGYIEDYIIALKGRGLSRSYINQGVCAIQLFLVMNDIVLNWKKLKKILSTVPTVKANDKPYSNANIRKMLEVARSLRNKAIIHFIAASGVRVGAVPSLKLKHLVELPEGCKAVTVYADTPEEYVTFLTPEASQVLDDYFNRRRQDGEDLTPESPVFRARYRIGASVPILMTDNSLKGMMKEILRDANFQKKKDAVRFEQMRFHGLRKRFATILKLRADINQNLVEKLLGHKYGLDGSYYKPDVMQLFAEYKKAIADLTVDDAARVQAELREAESEITELRKKDNELVKMKADFEEKISKIEENQSAFLRMLAPNPNDPFSFNEVLTGILRQQYEQCKKENPELAEKLFNKKIREKP